MKADKLLSFFVGTNCCKKVTLLKFIINSHVIAVIILFFLED